MLVNKYYRHITLDQYQITYIFSKLKSLRDVELLITQHYRKALLMARMHSRGKGKSSSTKPYLTEAQSWVPINGKEVEKLVVQLYKKGNTQSQIGMILRDQYGVPSIKLVTGKKLLTILKENEVAPQTPEDLLSLIRRAMNLRNHLSENKKDLISKHGLLRIESKLRKLAKYYREDGILSSDWRYTPENASVLLR